MRQLTKIKIKAGWPKLFVSLSAKSICSAWWFSKFWLTTRQATGSSGLPEGHSGWSLDHVSWGQLLLLGDTLHTLLDRCDMKYLSSCTSHAGFHELLTRIHVDLPYVSSHIWYCMLST